MLQTNPEELVANTFRIVEYPGHVIQHLAITYGHLNILIPNTVSKKNLILLCQALLGKIKSKNKV